MKPMIRTLVLTLLADSLAVWAFGGIQFGILNGTNAALSTLHAQDAAANPSSAPAATATPVGSATLTPPPPSSTATATGTLTPTVTPTLTPIAATTQMLLQNGVLAPEWWGYAPSFGVWNGNVNGVAATAAMTDTISGETTVLSYANTLANDSEIDCQITNGAENPVNAGNYYASGHIQFDIMLGPAFVSPTTIMVLYGGDFFNGIGWVYGCYSSPIPGLSQTTFTHVSIPFTTGYGSCVDMNAFYSLTFVASDSALTMPVGVQFYINDVQITPN